MERSCLRMRKSILDTKQEFATGVLWWSAMDVDHGAEAVKVTYAMSRGS